MELLKIIFLTASCWATLTVSANPKLLLITRLLTCAYVFLRGKVAGNANRDQDLFWAARGKKALNDVDWGDAIDPYLAAIIDKRDGSMVPFWAARGKKFALESPEGMPFWAARGKKGNFCTSTFQLLDFNYRLIKAILNDEKNRCRFGLQEAKGFL